MQNYDYKKDNVGVWIMGALGDIAATVITGSLAINKGLTSKAGLVCELPPFSDLKLVPTSHLVFGGFDIADKKLSQCAESLYKNSKTISRELLDAVLPELEEIDSNIQRNNKYKWDLNNYESNQYRLPEIISDLRASLQYFKQKNNLSHVVVVNLSSVEPTPPLSSAYNHLDTFEKLLDDDRKDMVSASMACAYVALKEKCSYINFTPNIDIALGCLQELARQQNVPYYGNDGKTGETLVKTALAPMFYYRHLEVMSWEGTNMLGNNDGKSLSNPENRVSKISNKKSVLQNILGYPVHSGVHIDYVPSLGDWKTAWDFIHFKGFLDVTMSMQFTWHGCDSVLAAPLILDLVRFSEFSARHGESGPMYHLASFFKNPLEVEEMMFHKQFENLLNYTKQHLVAASDTDKISSIKSK